MMEHLYYGAAFGQERRPADMFLLFLKEFILGHLGSNSSKADKTNGVERAILIASVGEERSCLKCHGEPPEGTQHYSSLVTGVYEID